MKKDQPFTSFQKHQEEQTDSLSEMKPLKSFDFSQSSGFVCDFDTGVCGPVHEEEENKE